MFGGDKSSVAASERSSEIAANNSRARAWTMCSVNYERFQAPIYEK
jgi:hypothetical protein